MAGWWAMPSASRLRSRSLYVDTNEVDDLVKADIIDPTMVTRSALQNAASIAKNILTTEAIVAEPLEQAGAGSNPEGRQLDADRELALLALPHSTARASLRQPIIRTTTLERLLRRLRDSFRI